MKMKWLCLLLALATSAQAATDALPGDLQPQQAQGQAASLATQLLTRYHYKPIPLDAAMSEKIFDRYLKSLDSEKLIFVQADLEQLARYRTELGEALLKEDLRAPFAIFNRYAQRVGERFGLARELLKNGFDFAQKERYQYERDNADWPASELEMRDLWHKRVKNDWLRLKLAGQDDASIARILDKRYEHALKRFAQVKSDEAFQTFMNAYTMAIEPHTSYLGTAAAADFDQAMSLSLVGIGGVLEEKDGYTTLRELVPGGPAALSRQLQIGDRIVGVAQGASGAMTDVVGWRLDDTVAQIRGEVDSVVVLDVLPAELSPDGRHKQVTLIRKKISLAEQAAKKSVLTVIDGATSRRIGVISLPSFYEDYDARRRGDPQFKSASHDVARLLDELKAQKVDGVLIDLRNNGGGSLSEAVDLTGLFIGRGPVVQQRDPDGKLTVESSVQPTAHWDGPLEVLINRGSASASEIFAAAIQDYGRGLVIGERSYGKGTVQTVINLDRLARNEKPKLGELKMTVAQFFRINGGTTQLHGVRPDIEWPALADTAKLGEAQFDNALPSMQVTPADFTRQGNLTPLLPTLQKRHASRIKTDPDFQNLVEDLAQTQAERAKNEVSLNEAERRQERQYHEARQASRRTAKNVPANAADTRTIAASETPHATPDDGLLPDERPLASELAGEKAPSTGRDILLDEAAHILSDEVGVLQNVRPATVRVKPQQPSGHRQNPGLGTAQRHFS